VGAGVLRTVGACCGTAGAVEDDGDGCALGDEALSGVDVGLVSANECAWRSIDVSKSRATAALEHAVRLSTEETITTRSQQDVSPIRRPFTQAWSDLDVAFQ
jgi:hypothetical protein